MTMLTPTEAARLILEHIAPLPAVRRSLREALDLVLAEDVASPIDLPPWDNSAMDGYAARSGDVAGASPERKVVLAVVESVAAGQFPARPIGPGQATRIFTGAPLPAGADTVVRQEDTEGGGPDRVTVVTGRDARKNVRYRGEDIRKGEIVLPAGTPLGPAQLGVLASIAQGAPLVHRAPRVAFMGSGDEIVDLDRSAEILAGKKIATSNSYTLHALIRRAGGIPVDLGLARDTKDSLREHLGAARDADLLVTTAGVSVGEHDFVREVLAELGCDMKLWRIRMRPGAPLGFGLLDRTPVDRVAGQPGQHDGDVRAVRAPGDPAAAGPPAPVPAYRAGVRGRADHPRPQTAALPAGGGPTRGSGRWARGALDGSPGFRHPDVHGPRQRPPDRARGPGRGVHRRDAHRPAARRSTPRG